MPRVSSHIQKTKAQKITPAIIGAIPAGIVAGKTQTQIAKECGLRRETVNRYANSPALKTKIELMQKRLENEAYETATENLINAITKYKTVTGSDTENVQRREHGFKASIKVLEGMGILPAHAQSILVSQVFNTQNNIINNPILDQVLSGLDIQVIEEEEACE